MESLKLSSKQSWRVLVITLAGLVLCAWMVALPTTWANEEGAERMRFGNGRVCSATAMAALKACRFEVRDDLWTAVGACNNQTDAQARFRCLKEAGETFRETYAECREQSDARLEICDEIGEAAYDPQLDPEQFIDFEEVVDGEAFQPNPRFPLIPGSKWTYVTRDEEGHKIERIKVEVLAETKEILGINCIVVHDRVWEFGEEGERELIEDTLDWYAQDVNGNVWYMGEIAKEYEDGDLVGIEGSWKAGRDLAKAGILMYAAPQEGQWYRQEFLLGEAEDMAEVAGYLDTLTVRGTTYHDVLQTREFTPIEPDVLEYKYYAPGIGVVLEEAPEAGERMELVRYQTP